MKILHVYRTPPTADCNKLVAIVSEGNENESFNLYDAAPNYDKLIDQVLAADKTITWW